jgi:hypothetical protein
MFKVKIDFSKGNKWAAKLSNPDFIQAMNEVQRDMRVLALSKFNAVVRTWATPKPEFKAWTGRSKTRTYLQITTDDKRFHYVDRGTNPTKKFIEAKPGHYLRFRANYKCKTKVGVLSSFQGGGSGPWVYAKKVRAGKIEGRGFSWRIGMLLMKETRKAWNKVARRWWEGKL